jgi:capsular polysaccharide biosynthesis protein
MWRKIKSRWWMLLVGFVIGTAVPAWVNMSTVPLYVGRTTMMAAATRSGAGSHDVQRCLANLQAIAASQRVMQKAALTLQDLGMSSSPAEILSHTSIWPVRDSDILAIEVTLPDQVDAKVAADVVAACVKKAYMELSSHTGPRVTGGQTELEIKTVDPAYIFPLDQHRLRKLRSGMVLGFLAGLLLAASLPLREHRRAVPTDGSDS